MKIQEYQQTNQVPDPSQAVMPQAHPIALAQPADLSGFVHGLGVAEDIHARSVEANGKAWSAEQTAKTRNDWTSELQSRRESAEPGAPDFTPKFLEDYDKYANGLLQNAPDDFSRKFLHQRLSVFRGEIGAKALEFEAKARQDYRSDKYVAGIAYGAKLMNTDPSQYADTLKETLALIDNSGIEPVRRSALRQQAIDKLSEAAVWSQMQKSPSDFLDSIGFGPNTGRIRKSSGDLQGETGNSAFDALPFDKRTHMFEQAITLKNQINMDADRQAEKMKKAISDDAAKELYGMAADGKLSRVEIDQRRSLLSPAEYHSFLKMNDDPDKPQKSDPGTFRHLQELMAADKFDEAASFALQSHKAGLLSNADLGSEVQRARSMARQDGPKSPFERARSFIVTSMDPGPLVHDPVGRSRLANALRDFEDWNIGGKRDGQEIMKQAEETVRRYKMVNFNDTIMALPLPKTGDIPRVNDPAKVLEAVARVGTEVQARRDRGQYSQGEYNAEMSILNRWRSASQPRK